MRSMRERRLTDADRHALAVLATGADAGEETRSLPIIETRCRSLGPLPISIAPLIGAPTLPFSSLYASVHWNTICRT